KREPRGALWRRTSRAIQSTRRALRAQRRAGRRENERGQRDASSAHGAALAAGGGTRVNGRSGLLTRSSFPAGIMLIVIRGLVRYSRATRSTSLPESEKAAFTCFAYATGSWAKISPCASVSARAARVCSVVVASSA